MRIISLDQNVISNLVKNDRDPWWRDLRDKLLDGVKSGNLLCPIPKETIAETVRCSRDLRIKIRDLHDELSLGFSFKRFGNIEGEETLALVRPSCSTIPYERIVWHSIEDEGLMQCKANEILEAQHLMRQRMDAFVAPPDHNGLTIREIRQSVLTSRAGSFFRQVERLMSGHPLDPTDDLQFDLCRFLEARGITKTELAQLRDKILTHEWEAIPIVFYGAALGALLDHGRIRGRKYKVSDESDIQRITIALHCCAIMITEKSMAYLVKQLEKEIDEDLEVFSVSDMRLSKFTW